MAKFIGRNQELEELKRLLKKRTSSLVVIRGRRRIGKSRLAEEFAKAFPKTYFFTGIPPEDHVTSAMQREEFARQMREQGFPNLKADDWGDLFYALSQECKKGKLLVVFDEITWMGSKDPTFLGKIKTAWDMHFKKNPELIMILSGSNSTWIKKNILESTGFFGRISLRMHLKELPLHECRHFFGPYENRVSSYEKFKIFSVTGGIPRYLEEIQPELSAEENIRFLVFRPGGLLFDEFNDIFSDLFLHNSPKYKDIVKCLVDGPKSLQEIATLLKRKRGGDLSQYLEDLCESGFVQRDNSWNFNDVRHSRIFQFRLRDNYVRFYLKYVEKNRLKIENQEIKQLPASWYSIMGLQFENLVLNNRKQIFRLLNIPLDEIVMANPYLQKKTRHHEKCQVDLLIQTRFNTLYLCEIKFEKLPIGKSVIKEVKNKIDSLGRPKGFTIRPVLIHVNGVEESVIESTYFGNIIDFGDLLLP